MSVPRLKPSHRLFDLKWTGISSDLESLVTQSLSRITGCRYVLPLSYGRTAIHLFCRTFLKDDRNQVLIPAFSCVVVPNAVVKAGGEPVWVDVRLQDANFDLQSLEEEAARSNAQIMILTHMFGNTCDIDACHQIAKRNEIPFVLTDAALALDSYYEGKHVASFTEGALLSFSVGKHMSFLEGGAFVTNDKKVFDSLCNNYRQDRKLRTWAESAEKALYYISLCLTYNCGFYPLADYLYNHTKLLDFLTHGIKAPKITLPEDLYSVLTQFQYRVAQSQIKRYPSFLVKRQQLQRNYFEALGEYSVTNQSIQTNTLSHFSIRVEDRASFHRSMRNEGVFCEGGLFDYDLPRLPQFKGNGTRRYPNAALLGKQIVNLPFYPGLKFKDQERIIQLTQEHLSRVKVPGNLQVAQG